MARLFKRRFEAGSSHRLRAHEVEVSDDLLHVAWIGLVPNSFRCPPDDAIQYSDFLVVFA